jgi:hypothetical protein
MALYAASGYHRIPNFGMWAGSELTACFAKDLPRGSATMGAGGPR